MVDAERLGIYGTSYGGATVVWVAAVDPRVKCVVSVVGVGNGQRWMRSVRRPDEYHDLLERSAADRVRRATEGHSEFVERTDILIPDRQSAELAAAARRGNPGAVSEIPLEFVDDTLGFNAEWVVDRIAPRPVLFITTDNDRLVPPEESEAMYRRAGEPKKLVMLHGFGHYEVYTGEAFRQVMARDRRRGSSNTCRRQALTLPGRRASRIQYTRGICLIGVAACAATSLAAPTSICWESQGESSAIRTVHGGAQPTMNRPYGNRTGEVRSFSPSPAKTFVGIGSPPAFIKAPRPPQ